MSKKDYEFIAECLRQIEDKDLRFQVTQIFAKKLEAKNPSFDAARFALACLKD